MKNNKGQVGAIVAVLAVFAILILGGMYLMGGGQNVIGDDKAKTDSSSNEFCANNPQIDADIRLRDSLADSSTYVDATLYFKETSSGTVISTTAGANSAFDTVSELLKCNEEYEVYVQSDQGGINGAYLGNVVADQEPVRVDAAVTNNSGGIQARVYDRDEAAWTWSASDGSAAGQYVTLNSTGVIFYSTTNATAKTVGADGELNYRIDAKTVNTNKAYGVKTLLAVDYSNENNADDWDEPTIRVDGKKLSDMRGSLSSNDQLALSGMESVYDFGFAVGDSATEIDVEMITGDGINADYDPTFWFVGTGVYTEDDNPNTILGIDNKDDGSDSGLNSLVGFRTDSSRTELVTSSAYKLKFDVA